jgi:hypothetical protein
MLEPVATVTDKLPDRLMVAPMAEVVFRRLGVMLTLVLGCTLVVLLLLVKVVGPEADTAPAADIDEPSEVVVDGTEPELETGIKDATLDDKAVGARLELSGNPDVPSCVNGVLGPAAGPFVKLEAEDAFRDALVVTGEPPEIVTVNPG